MIYLVRHAHAGPKQTWSSPDSRRPLQPRPAGGRRAPHPVPPGADHQDRLQSRFLPADRLAAGQAAPPRRGARPAPGRGRQRRPSRCHAAGSRRWPCRALHPRRTDRPALGPAPPGWIPDRHRRHVAQGIDLGAGPLHRPDHAGNLPAGCAAPTDRSSINSERGRRAPASSSDHHTLQGSNGHHDQGGEQQAARAVASSTSGCDQRDAHDGAAACQRSAPSLLILRVCLASLDP